MYRLAGLCSAILLAAPCAAAPPLPKAPPGFEVELVLEAPAIEAPTALCVAANGDVYFAEDPMDMEGPPTRNIDRIWLLKGGDPRKKVLFADKMWAVMGLEVVGNKLYVVHAPYVTVFTLDRDGKAAGREDLFTDLGPPVAGVPSFNDHIPSGIRMGMDGWLYVSIGDKGIPKMTRKEADEGSTQVAEGRWRHTKEGHHISLEGGGIIRFRPDGSGLEVFASGTRNHLDVPLDDHDRIFVRDNTDDGLGWWTRLMYLPRRGFLGYPWAYTRRPAEVLPMVRDFGGGSPCGGWVYLDDGLPATYRGRVFHCEWGQGKVYAVKVAPDGAGFKFVDQISFLDPEGTGVKDFRPFTLRPTADGRGFYVTDWSFNGWLAKAKAGRLWKVTYTGRDVTAARRGRDADSVVDLIASLGHPAHSERLRAQRALIARDPDAAEAIANALRRGGLSAQAQAHALWVLRAGLPQKWLDHAERALDARDAGLRLEAVRVLGTLDRRDFPHGLGKRPDPADVLVSLASNDSDPAVRLHAAGGVARLARHVNRSRELLHLLDKERDPTLRPVLVQAVKEAGRWRELDEALAADDFLRGQPAAIAGLVQAVAEELDKSAVAILSRLARHDSAAVRKQAVAALARVYKDRKPYAGGWWGTQPAGQKPPLREVAWEGTEAVRDALLHALGDTDALVRRAALAAVVDMRNPKVIAVLITRFGVEKDEAARLDLVHAVGSVGTAEAVKFLMELAVDGVRPVSVRLEAMTGLGGLTGLSAPYLARVTEALQRAAGKDEPVAVQVRALEALATLGTGYTWEVVAPSLKSPNPGVRVAAIHAIARVPLPGDVKPLAAMLNDADREVRVAAVRALGALGRKENVPALLGAAADEATQFEAVTALARMPDTRALGAYLTGLTSKNADLRQACRKAIAALGEKVVPALEEMARRNEIAGSALAELREVYSSFVPVLSWRVIGPFPRDGKAQPPESELKFDGAYKGVDKEVKWRQATGDAAQSGRVNCLELFSPNQQVECYGYAEIDSVSAREATLQVGSDDTITIWINGKKAHEHLGDRGWAPDQDKVTVKLEKGKNRLLIKCGNSGGPWDFSVAVSAEADRYAFLRGARKFDLETYRAFARKTPGDPRRGEPLFRDLKGLACIKCHAVSGEGGQVGPDLAGIALKYKRDDLMTSVLEPSKIIAQGYETIVLTTTAGRTLTGVFKGENADAVTLADAEGKVHVIAKKDIDERAFSPVSIMPNGLNEGMTLQDFADVIAFLEARREEKPKAGGGR